jgi:hypothetical protein
VTIVSTIHCGNACSPTRVGHEADQCLSNSHLINKPPAPPQRRRRAAKRHGDRSIGSDTDSTSVLGRHRFGISKTRW